VENSKQKKGDADDRHGRSRGMQATGFKAFWAITMTTHSCDYITPRNRRPWWRGRLATSPLASITPCNSADHSRTRARNNINI
jgi:hypothetical protein